MLPTKIFTALGMLSLCSYAAGLAMRAPLTMSSAQPAAASTDPPLLNRDRYIATNRFTVRDGKNAAFEKRWATRKSRLADLDGFKYFHLMRRVHLDPSEPEVLDDPYNYVSFTIWEDKKAFNAWRKGDAFKEAHGGTSIMAFLGAMLGSLRVLKGPPRPAFYDGLLVQAAPPASVPETVGGWRSVDADGVSLLPAEAFVAVNQFFVPDSNAAVFEQRWASRESALAECDGFVCFSMLRRDGKTKGHGVKAAEPDEPTYQSTTVWRDRTAFDAWRTGSAFKKAHGSSGGGAPLGGAGPPTGGASPLMWTKPPKPAFYEATLVLSSPEGA